MGYRTSQGAIVSSSIQWTGDNPEEIGGLVLDHLSPPKSVRVAGPEHAREMLITAREGSFRVQPNRWVTPSATEGIVITDGPIN
jgi:hypothetical protein